MVLYIITKSHFSGDHCHIVGVYTIYDMAKLAYDSYTKKLGFEECLLELHTISDTQINTQLYSFECEDIEI